MAVSEENGKEKGSDSEEQSPSGEETLNGATGRYDLPGEGSEGELLARKVREASIKKFEVGEHLFHAGQPATCFWMIRSGRVAQYKGETRISEMGPNRFLGMRTFMLGGKFETTAQVIEPSKIIELGQAFLEDFLKLPTAVLAFLKEQELELFRLTEAGRRCDIFLVAAREENTRLKEQLKRGVKATAGNGAVGELTLQEVKAKVNAASKALDDLAKSGSVPWKVLQKEESFLLLYLAIKDAAEKLGGIDLSSRASRHE